MATVDRDGWFLRAVQERSAELVERVQDSVTCALIEFHETFPELSDTPDDGPSR